MDGRQAIDGGSSACGLPTVPVQETKEVQGVVHALGGFIGLAPTVLVQDRGNGPNGNLPPVGNRKQRVIEERIGEHTAHHQPRDFVEIRLRVQCGQALVDSASFPQLP